MNFTKKAYVVSRISWSTSDCYRNPATY